MGQRSGLSDKDVAAARQMYPGCYKAPIRDIVATSPTRDRLTLATLDRKPPTLARLDIKPTVARFDIRATLARLDRKPTVARLDIKPTLARIDRRVTVARLDFKTTPRTDIKSPTRDIRPTIATRDLKTVPNIDIRKGPRLDKNPITDRIRPKNCWR